MPNSRRAILGVAAAVTVESALGQSSAPRLALTDDPKTDSGARSTPDLSRGAVTPHDFMSAEQRQAVSARARTHDITQAVAQMFMSGARNFFFPPGDYPIFMKEGSPLVRLVHKRGIVIRGQDALLYDPLTYTSEALSPVFELESCSDVSISGLDYEGMPIVTPSDPDRGVGYRGATFVNLKSGCSQVEVQASLKHLRYGVRSGDYVRPEHGNNRNIRTILKTYRCGYPIAHYLAEHISAILHTEASHRSAYLAGVHNFDVQANFKDQLIAPIQVIVTDAIEAPGRSRGCSSGKVVARDMGSTMFVPNSWCAGIALSRVDPGTVFEDLAFEVHATGTDRVATTLGAFVIVSGANRYMPAYDHNWEQSITLRRITVRGTLNRSAQTVPGNSAGDLYIKTFDSPNHYATVEALDISQLNIIAGKGRPTVHCVVPGLSSSRGATFAMCAARK
jgi:hypothetical protein